MKILDCETVKSTWTHHEGDFRPVVALPHAGPKQGPKSSVEAQRSRIPRVEDGAQEGYSAHGPVTAQVAREAQQPVIKSHQIVHGQLPAGGCGRGSGIVKSKENSLYIAMV